MCRAAVLLTLIGPCAVAIAQPPPGYYDAAQGLSGSALRNALADIIDGHTVLSNADLWNAFETTDDRPDGFVWDIYSDVPGGTPPYLYSFGTDQCGTYNSEGDCYNREHTMPQSWFGSGAPMDTDLHHILPTDGWVNQQRGNLPYGEVGATDWTGQNGTRVGESNWPGYTGTVCEPIDAYKGDAARIYFYMMTRYVGQVGGWSSPMLQAGDLSPWAESLLLSWHTADPVSTKEVDRNNAIYALQGNRNPFIDNPAWASSLWGPVASIELDPDEFYVSVIQRVGSVHLKRSGAEGSQVRLLDAAGRTVVDQAWSTSEAHLPLPGGGPLLLEVRSPRGRRVWRLMP
ncbi:MAG: endonuclease [Flavobacteriales bacterium]|nr:endonuclease [Flavobacteriales bacterium]